MLAAAHGTGEKDATSVFHSTHSFDERGRRSQPHEVTPTLGRPPGSTAQQSLIPCHKVKPLAEEQAGAGSKRQAIGRVRRGALGLPRVRIGKTASRRGASEPLRRAKRTRQSVDDVAVAVIGLPCSSHVYQVTHARIWATSSRAPWRVRVPVGHALDILGLARHGAS